MSRIINGPYGVYARDASHNHYELLITHDNYETGFQLQGASSNNTVLYLDSYRNRDPRKNGESADGFACKEGSGEGNVLRNARLWDNVDDGLDLFMFGSPVTLEEVYAWGNGFNRWGFSSFEGDGNGFKLGITDNPPANHIVRNSMAFANAKKGFIDNGNPGSLTFERNTAWNNGDVGFNLRSSSSTMNNNIAVANVGSSQVSLTASGIKATGNSWQSGVVLMAGCLRATSCYRRMVLLLVRLREPTFDLTLQWRWLDASLSSLLVNIPSHTPVNIVVSYSLHNFSAKSL